MEWQLKSTAGCETHQLRLLSKCPSCGARFKVPALWEDGYCVSAAALKELAQIGVTWLLGKWQSIRKLLSEVFFLISGGGQW
jgi:hypothetical protein